MTRDEELQAALSSLEHAIDVLSEAVYQIGLLRTTLRRLLVQEPDFDYRTGMPPDALR
jgi:hypothetical protein